MSSVIKKKKKPLTATVIDIIKRKSTSQGQEDIVSDSHYGDNRTTDNDIATIASRRNELKAMRHENTDAIVRINDSD